MKGSIGEHEFGMMNEFMNDSTELMNMNVRGITNVKGMKDEYMNEFEINNE